MGLEQGAILQDIEKLLQKLTLICLSTIYFHASMTHQHIKITIWKTCMRWISYWVLWSFILYCHCYSRWNVSYPNSTVCGVYRLTSTPTRSVCINFQVFITQLNINLQSGWQKNILHRHIILMKHTKARKLQKNFKRKRKTKWKGLISFNSYAVTEKGLEII